MAWAHARDLAPHGATAVSLTPGWMRSEMMLDIFGVREGNWRDATAVQPHFVISETPGFTGRAVTALASIRSALAGTAGRCRAAGWRRSTASTMWMGPGRIAGATWTR
jgi:NAD(P)-dependent dehydrogenase (short-subunit alcohol dehydrogenase family)